MSRCTDARVSRDAQERPTDSLTRLRWGHPTRAGAPDDAATRPRRPPPAPSTSAPGIAARRSSRRPSRPAASAYDIYNHMYLPGYYADPVEEYWALLNDVTVWDVSVERIVEITGPDASAFTNLLTCRDLTKCAVGQGKYVLITADDGGIVNDPVLLRVEENRWWLALADSDAGLYARGVAVNSGMDVKVREPEVYPIQVQGPKSKDDAPQDLRRRDRRHQVLLDAHDRGRRDPGRHQPDRLDGRGRLRDLPPGPVARRRPLGPRLRGRQGVQHPAGRAGRGPADRGRHLQLRLGHDHREQPVRGHGPRAARRAPGGRLHRQGSARGDPGQGRRPQARGHRGRRATRCRSSSPRSARRSTAASRSGRSPTSSGRRGSRRTSATSGCRSSSSGPGTELEIVAPDGDLWAARSAAIPFLDAEEAGPAREVAAPAAAGLGYPAVSATGVALRRAQGARSATPAAARSP